MKTLAKQIRKSISRISAFAILGTTIFTSCQKDDIMSPGPPAGMESYNRSEVSRTKNASISKINDSDLLTASGNIHQSTAVFTVLTIDHNSVNTMQGNYRVEVKSNGTVLFTGRKNIATIGERKFTVSEYVINEIINMYNQNNFETLVNEPYNAGLPFVTTTFKNKSNMEEIIKIDSKSNASPTLRILRKTAEDMLNVTQYIYVKI